MSTQKPFLSIITINRNNAAGLRKTLESVRIQTCKNYEHIIIDGASTDESVDVIKEFLQDKDYAEHVTYWCSEKDTGVYNAMNKGVPYTNGKYCLFLNSGDYFCKKDVISKIEGLGTDIDIYYSNAILYTRNSEWIKEYPEHLTLGFLYKNSINHQNCLIKTDLQKKYPFTYEFQLVSDRDFFVKCFFYEKNLTTMHLDFIISKYEAENGLSSSQLEILFKEDVLLYNKYFSKQILDSFKYFEERLEKLDYYEKSYHGILKRILHMLKFYSKIKSKIRSSLCNH